MSSRHKNHLIKAEAANITTWCGKRSTDIGTGKLIREFINDTDGGIFYASAHSSVVNCMNCRNRQAKARLG